MTGVFPGRLSKAAVTLVDPYIVFCHGVIALWLLVWCAAIPNLYGWLVDDSDTFTRIRLYMLGGQHAFDIPWFHAYMWFLMLVPSKLHLALPSYSVPRAYEGTALFRGLIVYTICLHAIVLSMLAIFLRQLCYDRIVSAGAFVLVATSPTFALYTPLLDSRYLGFLVALPAMMLLMRYAADGRLSRKIPTPKFALPGLLLAIAEDVHYECLYFTVPFVATYWILVVALNRRDRSTYVALLYFALGAAIWIIAVQTLSRLYQPFDKSYIGTLFALYVTQMPPYSRAENLATWARLFISEMGLPMIIAVLGGTLMLTFRQSRPNYITRFKAYLMLGCIALFAAYVVVSPTFPFYRMALGLQFIYSVVAVVCIERLVCLARIKRKSVASAAALMLFIVIAYLPSFVRTPEVYVAQQGFGRAVNVANERRDGNRVHYIVAFDVDSAVGAKTVTTREQFSRLRPDDYLVTYFPISFHFKYPDLFALLYDTVPLASYPTLWCTREMWAQVPSFYGGRRWIDEPENCQAQVFRVSDIQHAAAGAPLVITSISADSEAAPGFEAQRALALRDPAGGWSGAELWRPYWDLWLSDSTPGAHWLELKFLKPASLRAITLVPPEFRMPPDFLWRGQERVEGVQIEGGTDVTHSWHALWSQHGLERRSIFTAHFPPQIVSRLRLTLSQSAGGSAVGLKYIRFPGYRQTTHWNNRDARGDRRLPSIESMSSHS